MTSGKLRAKLVPKADSVPPARAEWTYEVVPLEILPAQGHVVLFGRHWDEEHHPPSAPFARHYGAVPAPIAYEAPSSLRILDGAEAPELSFKIPVDDKLGPAALHVAHQTAAFRASFDVDISFNRIAQPLHHAKVELFPVEWQPEWQRPPALKDVFHANLLLLYSSLPDPFQKAPQNARLGEVSIKGRLGPRHRFLQL